MSTRIASIAAMFGLGLLFAACQPKDERPGLWLAGEDSSEAVSDWRFTGEVEEIFIETGTWYGVRHSTTIWCADLDGNLYIGSYYADDVKYWEKNVARNPEARLRIGDRIYDVSVTPVGDAELSERLDRRYADKYDMAEVFGDELPVWRYYQVKLRGEQGAQSPAETPGFEAFAAARYLGETRHETD